MDRENIKSQVEWNRQTPRDGLLLNQEYSNIYAVLNEIGSRFFSKTVTDNVTLASEDVFDNQIIFINPSAANTTVKLPSGLSESGKITFLLLSNTNNFTASITTDGDETIMNPIGMGNSFNYHDLMVPYEGVSLIYSSGLWMVEKQIGLPNKYQLGQVDFITVDKDKLPPSCLIADGSEVSRSQYRRLFDIIGVTFGAGDSTTTFNLPNLQSYFVRGTIDGTVLGTVQQDSLQNITGVVPAFFDNRGQPSGAFADGTGWSINLNFDGGGHAGNNFTFDASRVARTGAETRPKNVSLTPIIYF